MNFKENETEQKLRGGYYTPEPVARFLVRWALSAGARHILEPSCGDGRFLEAIGFEKQAGKHPHCLTVNAVEVLAEEAEKARQHAQHLKEVGIDVKVDNRDFFHWITNGIATAEWDAIVGNPPYIRYQYFDKGQRDIAERIFQQANVRFTKRTNAWVPFLIASVMHLAPGGRLAMVIPAEILHIQHAEGLRLLLEQEMKSIALISIRDMIFEDALQGIVLLLAVKRDNRKFKPLQPIAVGSRHTTTGLSDNLTSKPLQLPLSLFEELTDLVPNTELEIIDIGSLDHLAELRIEDSVRCKPQVVPYQGDWMKALLTPQERILVDRITSRASVKPFVEVADVDIGIVTGANDFFVVDEETLRHYELQPIASPMLAKSELIEGITYTRADHEANAAKGRSVHFLSFPAKPLSELPPLMVDYLQIGEAQELHKRYKCRIREPWYVVPYVWVSELSLLKRCHFYPRIVLNEVGAHSTDTAYRIKMKPPYESRARDLTFSFLNSFSFLYSEMLGRHYGGGVLELVPSEIEEIPMPLVTVSPEDFSKANTLIRNGSSLAELVDFTDNVILRQGIGLSPAEISVIRTAHKRLRLRRLRRDG